MRNKLLLFCCFLGFSITLPSFSQVSSGNFATRFVSPDSLRNFDENSFRINALREGYIGKEFDMALYQAKRQHIIDVYYPNAYDIQNYKLPPNFGMFAPPCVNEGFELGNFTGWIGTSGTNTNSCAYPTATTVIGAGPTLTVLPTPLVDPVTGVVVPNSPLGGSMVAKIGNTVVGTGKVTKITQNFLVTNSNYLYDFAYYAVQNGPHNCCQQPYMFVRLRDCVNNLLACPNFTFNAPATNSNLCPGTGPTNWLNTGVCPFGQCIWRTNGWQKYSMDLTQYIGTCVTIEVMVADCSPTGHYLYTYFDSNCNTMNLIVNGTNTVSMPSQTVTPQVLCGTTATLTAPGGLNPYLWNGPPLSGVTNNTNQTISTSVAGNYTLQMTPVGVCNPIFRIINLQFVPPATVTMNPIGGVCPGINATLTASGATNYTWMPGGSNSTSIVVSPTTTTIYTLTANTGTCTGSQTIQVNVNPSPTVNIAASSLSVCAGMPTTLTASGANTYSWSTGGIGSSVVVTPTTTSVYTVVGTSTTGCQGTSTVMIFVVPTPTSFVTVASPTLICIGGNSNLFASALGASSYTWFPGALVGNFVNVSPTITTQYTVVAANGSCTNSAVLTVSVDPGPTMTVVSNPTAICPGGTATLTASGAASYTWMPMVTVSSSVAVSPTVSTTYTVLGTSGFGCPGTKTITQVVSPIPNLTVTPASPTICIGTSVTLTASGASSYTWNPGGMTSSSVVVSPTINTTYTIIGSNGTCTSSITRTVTVVPIPTVGASASSPSICAGQTATLTGSGALSYTWNPGGLTGATVAVSPIATTNYTVIGSSGGCTSTAMVSLTVNTGPTITANASPTAICFGNSSTLTANGALSYTWNPGAITGSSITVSPGSTTIYSVTGNNLVGCTTTQTVNLIVTPNPTIIANANPTAICNGSSATLTANGATTYTWNPGALTGSNVVVSPTVTTTYTINGTTLGCAGQTTLSLIVTPTPTVSASVSPTAICVGATATLTANGAINYTWNPGALTGSNVVVTPTSTTTYTVLGSSGACSSNATVVLVVNPSPTLVANANPTAICVTGNVTLTANGAATYTWNPGALTGSNVVVSPLVTTSYSVTGTTGFGCTGTAVVSVTVNAVPVLTITASPTAICSGASSTLSAAGATSYTWNPGGLTGSSVAVSPTSTTVYTITGSNGGCSTTSTISLIVNPVPSVTATANPTNICSGNTSTLTGSGALTYTWNPGGLTGAVVTVTPPSTTVYTLTGANIFGCVGTATRTVSVTATPTIIAAVNPTAICRGASATLTANGATTYTWNPGALTGSSAVVSPTSTTLYTVTGSNGACNSTQTVNLIVNPNPTLTTGASPNPVCIGSPVTLTVSGANTYTWNPGALTGSNVVVSPTISTGYTVTGANLAGCTRTAAVNVTVNPLPTLTVVSTNTNICSGTSATLTASGASTYTWSPGGTNGSTLAVTPGVTATYTVAGTSSLGCVNTRTFTQVVTPTPTITANASPTAICSGNSTTLTASGALSYTWNPGGLSGATVVVTPMSTTIFTVTGVNGNCTSTQTVNLLVNPTPTLTASASPTVICAGSTTTLSVIGANSYTWNPGALTGNSVVVSPTINTQYTVVGQTLSGCNSTAVVNVSVNAVPVLSVTASATNVCIGSTATITASGASTYTWNPGAITGSSIVITPTANIVYTVTGQVPGGCTSSAQITINANPGPTVTASASPTVICAGQTATLTGNGATSYTWFPGGLTGTTIVVTPSVNTNYTVNGSNGSCISSALVSMSVIPSPTIIANANPTLICNGGTTTLTATGGLVYAWLPPALAGSMIVQSPTITTTYTVIGSSGTCTNTALVTVSVNSGPSVSITATPTIICLGNTTTLTAAGATNYTWQPGGSNATTIAVSPTTTTAYTLFGNSGSCTGSVAITITVNANPTITAGANPTVVCAGSLITLTVSGANSYSWNPIGVTGATVTDSPTITTIYTVTGTSLAGCSNTANVTVSVNALPTITATPSPTSICQGSSATITAIGATNYTWNPGALNGSSIVVNPTVTTTYTINGQDLLGCVGNNTVQLVVFPTTPTISPVSNPTAICAGSSATLTATGATSYTWNPGALTGSNVVVNPTVTTTYTVDGSNGICGGASATITLVVNDLPANVTASVSSIITCATPSVDLFGSTTSTLVSYLWNGPGAYTSAVQNPTGIAVPGIYTLTVFNNLGGCSSTATVAVLTDSNIPTATITINGTITCADPTATLMASATPTNVNYNWSGPSSFTSSLQSPTISLGGTYTLTVVDISNNCQASTVFIVTTNTTVPISATIVPATCSGTMANNDAMIIVSGFIPTDHYDFVAGASYTGSATYTSAPAIPLTGILTNTLNNPLAPMPYTVRFFGANGCTKDTTLILLPTSCITNTVFGLAKAVSVPSLQTNGSYNVTYTIVVKNSGPDDLNDITLIEDLSLTFPLPTTFSITSAPMITSQNSSLTLDPAFNGTLQTVMTQSATSKLKAGKSDTIVFSLNIIPNGIFGPFNNSVIGYASPTTAVVFGDSSNTGYDPDPDLNGNPTDNDLPTVLNLPPNLFFGLTKVGTLGEKQDNDSYDISYAITVHNLGNDTLYSVTVKDSLFNNTIRQPATYVMKNGPLVSGTGSLTANSSYNGNSDVNLIIPSQSKMPPGTTATINFTINVNPDTVTVVRNSATGLSMNSASTVVTDISNDGTNPDSNNNGVWNEDADNVPTVLIIPNSGTLFIPNGFTPNDDNKNDVWFIKGLPKDTKVTIYNRWGNKVYSKDNYDNTWNGYPNVSGTLGSEKLSQGTYYYIIEFKDSAVKPKNGFVVIQY